MSESGGMNVKRLTAGGQTVATDVKGNITTLPVNLRPAGSTTAMNRNWDSDNKLRSADIDANGTADVNFQYNALGRRVARTGSGSAVVYVQMDQQTIADYPVGGAASTPTYRYVYASYIDEPVVRKTAGTGGTLMYFHRNQQYSVTAITTSTGAVAERYAYSAYGQPTILDASASALSSSAINNRYTYTGREWDATLGLYHFRARWMSPVAGRFITREPVGFEGSEWNDYEFFDACPLLRLDWMGHKSIPCDAAGTASCDGQCAEYGKVAVSCSCSSYTYPVWNFRGCGWATDLYATPVCEKYVGKPGKCTPQRHNWLRIMKEVACNGAAQPSRGMSCDRLLELFEKNLACAAARSLVAKECFDDNDPTYKGLIDEYKLWAQAALTYWTHKPCWKFPKR